MSFLRTRTLGERLRLVGFSFQTLSSSKLLPPHALICPQKNTLSSSNHDIIPVIKLYGYFARKEGHVPNRTQSSSRSRKKWLQGEKTMFDQMSFRKKHSPHQDLLILGRAGHGPPQGGVSASKKRSPTPSLHTIVQNQTNIRSLLTQFFVMTQRVIMSHPRLEQYIDPSSAQTSPILPSAEEDGRRTLAGDATSSLGNDSEAGGSRLSRLFSINRR